MVERGLQVSFDDLCDLFEEWESGHPEVQRAHIARIQKAVQAAFEQQLTKAE